MHANIPRKALLALGTTGAIVALAAAEWPRDTSAGLAYRDETARIQRHFDSVLVELRVPVARDLTLAQRSARAERIARLQAYRDRGVFPHNHEFHDGWMPYFVDHRGVHCAVAFLLHGSGRDDIVARVRASDNNVWVGSLAGDTAFASWLDDSGLTLAEAAHIQVPYVGTPPESNMTATRDDRINTGLAVMASGLGAASIAWNARADGSGHRKLRVALGYTAGAMGMALAAGRRDADGGPLALGIATGAIGIGSAAMATRALMRSGGAGSPVQRQPSTSALRVSPALLANGERMQPGVTMNLRF